MCAHVRTEVLEVGAGREQRGCLRRVGHGLLLAFVLLLGAWLSELARFFGLKVGEYSGSFKSNYIGASASFLKDTTVLVVTMIDLGGLHQRS